MNLRGIVSVSGKPGLWKALAQNKTGFILESLDAQKTKLVANLATAKIAALDEITIFGDAGDIKLTDVFENMTKTTSVPDAKADGRRLREFFRGVAPDHDEEKVYASDMKKIVSWYHILKDMPLFTEAAGEQPAEPQEQAASTEAVTAAVSEPVEAVTELAETTTAEAETPKPAKKKTAKK